MYDIRATKTGHRVTLTPPANRTLAWAMQRCRNLLADPIDMKASWVIEHVDGGAVVPVAVAMAVDGKIYVMAEHERPLYRAGGMLDLSDVHRRENPNCGVCSMQRPCEMAAQSV